MMLAMDTLSLRALEQYDLHAPLARGTERRFLCPFPACADKRNSRRHRSLSVNVETGAYYCHRCQRGGGLCDVGRSLWQTRADDPRSRVRQAFRLPPPAASATAPLEGAATIGVPITQSLAGLTYLERRGIPEALATAAGLRFCPTWGAVVGGPGWPAVMFPLRDEQGAAIGAHGRVITGPGKLTRGPTRATVFATPGALTAPTFAVTEGPMDALSLALCGLPAVAMIGTTPPYWLCKRTFGRTGLIATDADQAGDGAAEGMLRLFGSYGGTLERLRPPEGYKDWNEMLCALGADAMGSALRSRGGVLLMSGSRP